MENTPNGQTENEGAQQADTSGVSIKSKPKARMPLGESKNLSSITTATTSNASPKTWKSAELEVLRLKLGLVAGVLQDFQRAGGLVAVREVQTELASGRQVYGVKFYLVADGLQIKTENTNDGLDFILVADSKNE